LTLTAAPKQQGPQSVVTLFACRPGQRSWEIHLEGQKGLRGLLSLCLEEGLRYGAAGPDRKITVGSLAEYAGWRVDELARSAGKPQAANYTIQNATGAEVVIASHVPASPTPQPFEAAFHQGYLAFSRGDYNGAYGFFEEAAKTRRTSSVLNMMGECQQLLKNLTEAENLYREAIAVYKNAADARHNLANLMMRSDRMQYTDAEKLYRESLELDPGSTVTTLALANSLSRQKRFHEAEVICKAASDRDPGSPLIPFQLALIRWDQEDTPGAAKLFERTIQLDSEFWDPHMFLGQIAATDKRPSDAEKHYREVCRILPKYARAHFEMSKALRAMGKAKEADDEAAVARKLGWIEPPGP
jgi:tetratricopeptide (TPR) repeat protein